MHVLRFLLPVGFLAVTIIGGAGAQTPPPSIQFVIPQLQKMRTPAARATSPARLTSAAKTDYWWNTEEFIEALGLDEAQRQKMDAAMSESATRIKELQHKQNTERERYDNALRDRDWTAARSASTEWELAFAQSWGVQNRSKIDVLMQLTPGQHDKLVRDFAYMLGRPWTTGHRMTYSSPPRTPAAEAQDSGTKQPAAP